MKKAAKIGAGIGFFLAVLAFVAAYSDNSNIASPQNLGTNALVFAGFTLSFSLSAVVLRGVWIFTKKLFSSATTVEMHDETSGSSGKWPKYTLIFAALVAALFTFDYLQEGSLGRTWRAAKSGNTVNQIYAKAADSNTNNPPVMRFICENSELHTIIEFGIPIKDSYQGTQYTLAKVAAIVDDDPATTIGFSFLGNNRGALISTDHSSVSGGIKSLGVGIDNLIFNALGMKNHARISWNPEGMAGKMRYAKQITLSTGTQSGQRAFATFKTDDFAEAYVLLPSHCRASSGIWP